MDPVATLVGTVLALGLLAGFLRLVLTQRRVTSYHRIPTPRVNELTHGGNGDG